MFNTKLTGHQSIDTYFQLREFVVLTGFCSPFKSFHSFRKQEVVMLDMARNVSTMQVIAKTDSRKNSNHTSYCS